MWHVIGQPKTVALLQRGLDEQRLAHAYLFVGPRHVGKTTLAIDLACAVNCESPERPCGNCRSCTRIAAGKHPDIQLIGLASEAKTEVGIEQVRDMQQAAGLPPFEGKRKVFLLGDAENLSPEAANCLLKILEEPSPHLLFVLMATSDSLVLPTVLSRCQRVELRPLDPRTLEEALVELHGVPEERAKVLARLSKGRLGWAIAAARDEGILQERTERLSNLLAAIDATPNHRFAYADEIASQSGKNRGYSDEILALWVDWWRDLLLMKGGAGESIINLDHESALRRQASNYSLGQIRTFLGSLTESRAMIRQNVNPRLTLETLMLCMP